MSPFLIVAAWVGMSILVGGLLATGLLGKRSGAAFAGFLAGVAVLWVLQGGDRIAAERWREGGREVAIACAHTTACVDWLQFTEDFASETLPGEVTFNTVCGDEDLQALFGLAAPCFDEE